MQNSNNDDIVRLVGLAVLAMLLFMLAVFEAFMAVTILVHIHFWTYVVGIIAVSIHKSYPANNGGEKGCCRCDSQFCSDLKREFCEMFDNLIPIIRIIRTRSVAQQPQAAAFTPEPEQQVLNL